MCSTVQALAIYLHLAQASLRRGRPLVRARMLVLASVEATLLKCPRVAAYCREEILAQNPRHLIGHWPTLHEALVDDEFVTLLKSIRKRYPHEKAESMLDGLGIDVTNEWATYYSYEEYAAAILGLEPNRFLPDES